MKIFYYSIILSVFLIASCNSTPKLNKETIQGTWVCFDYSIQGPQVDKSFIDAATEISKQTTHTFKGDTLIMQNSQFTLAFKCDYNFEQKEVSFSPIGFNDVSERLNSIIDFTGDVMVLQETIQGVKSTTYLKREKE